MSVGVVVNAKNICIITIPAKIILAKNIIAVITTIILVSTTFIIIIKISFADIIILDIEE